MATMVATPESLRQLLLELAQQDVALADKADQALRAATARYASSKPDLDPDGTPIRSGISEDRAAIRKVEQKATDLQAAIAALSAHARLAIGAAMDAPLGSLTIGLKALVETIPEAAQQLRAEKDKAGDYHLKVWAYEVALVLRDVLHIAPSATRHHDSERHVRGGAAYARLLQEAHKSISPRSLDIGRLTSAGLALLKNPTGDQVK